MTNSSGQHGLRIGLDLGGSKSPGPRGEGVGALSRSHATRRLRGYYRGHCRSHSQAHAGHRVWREHRYRRPRVYLAPHWPMQNANSTWLNGRAFDRDLAVALATPVRLANDANCFALSEAIDSAAGNARIVFGVILGTGCGGGLVVNGRLVDGPRGIGGATTPSRGPCRTDTPGPTAGADAKGAWKHGFRDPAWLPIMPR